MCMLAPEQVWSAMRVSRGYRLDHPRPADARISFCAESGFKSCKTGRLGCAEAAQEQHKLHRHLMCRTHTGSCACHDRSLCDGSTCYIRLDPAVTDDMLRNRGTSIVRAPMGGAGRLATG